MLGPHFFRTLVNPLRGRRPLLTKNACIIMIIKDLTFFRCQGSISGLFQEAPMKRYFAVAIAFVFLLFSIAPMASAGSRYSHGYRDYSYKHHRPYYHHSYRYPHHADRFFTHLGIGLLAGAVVGSIFYEPPRQQTLVYTVPPPTIIYRDERVVSSRPIPPPATTTRSRTAAGANNRTNGQRQIRSGTGLGCYRSS